MKQFFILILTFLLLGCKKEEKTSITGTYTVEIVNHNNIHSTGTVTLTNTDFTLLGNGQGSTPITATLTINGNNFTLDHNNKVHHGSGIVDNNNINGVVGVFYSGGSVDNLDFEGFK